MGFFDDVASSVAAAAPQLPNPATIIQNPGPLVSMGMQAVGASPILAAVASVVPQAAQTAFNLGIAAAQHAGVSPSALGSALSTLHNSLPNPQSQQAFNLALSLMHGARTAPPLPPTYPQNVDPGAKAAWLAVFGAKAAPPSFKVTLGPTFAAMPLPPKSVVVPLPPIQAATDAAAHLTAKQNASWFHKLLVKLHLAPAAS